MVRPKPSAHTLMLAAAGFCSLWAGHEVQYQLLVPDEAIRSRVLEKTGHGYLPWALPAAIVVGLLAVSAAAALGYARERRSGKSMPSPLGSGLKIAGAQVGAFLLLETAEPEASGPSAASGAEFEGQSARVTIPFSALLESTVRRDG